MASRSLGTLTVDLLAKTGLLEQGLDKGGRAAQKFARDIDRQANSVQASFDKAFTAVGIAAGAAFAAVGLAVKNSIEEMGQLVTYAKQVAMPVDQFSAYAAAANNAEISTQTFTSSLAALDKAIASAKQGNAKYASLFTALGIDPKKIRSTTQGFKQVSDAFARYRDDANKVAISMKLFGNTEMIAFADKGSVAIQKLADRQRDLGNALDENGAKKWDAYDDAMDEFHNAVAGLTKTLALDLLPTITDVTKRATDFIQAWRDDGGLQKFIGALETLMDHLGEIAVFFATRLVATRVIAGFVGMASAATALGTAAGVLRAAFIALGGPIGIVATAVAGLVTWYVQSSKGSTELATSTDTLATAMQALHGLTGQSQADARAIAIEDVKAALAAQLRVKAEIDKYDAIKKLSQQMPDTISIGPMGAMGGSVAAVTTGVDAKRVENLRKQYEASRVAVSDMLKEIEKPIRAAATPDSAKPSIVLPKLGGSAKETIDKLTGAYDALAKASASYANSLTADDPLQKANEAMAAGVENLAKLREAYIKAGGSAKLADELFTKGLAGLKDQFTFDLGQPKRELDAYTGSLRDQLDALKASNEAKLQGLAMGEHAAQNAQALAQATQEATKAITDFVQAHQLHPEAMSEDMYKSELAALQDYYAKRNHLIKQQQAAEDAIRGDMGAGWQKGIADFIEQTQNKFQQGQQLAQQFTSGFADAFEKFASGAESAKKAFGDFIDDLFAQALRFVANQALAKIFEAFGGGNGQAGSAGGSGGGWGGLVNAFASYFGGGRAGGGPVAAGGLYMVNENGPELLAVGGRQYLMMGPQAGVVQPASHSRAPGGTTINVAVQPTSTRRTADQVATAVARQQRIATSRNG